MIITGIVLTLTCFPSKAVGLDLPRGITCAETALGLMGGWMSEFYVQSVLS